MKFIQTEYGLSKETFSRCHVPNSLSMKNLQFEQEIRRLRGLNAHQEQLINSFKKDQLQLKVRCLLT